MTETIDHKIHEPTKENSKQFPKSTKIKAKILLALGLFGFASGITGCDGFVEHMAQDDLFTGPKDNSPAVLNGQRIFAEQQAGESPTSEPPVPHESFELPTDIQRIFPGSRVQVVETGGLGLNVRTEASVNANLITTVPEGTIFKVIDIVEGKNYTWVLVRSEDLIGNDEIVGYVAAVDKTTLYPEPWLQVLKNEPAQ